MANANLTLRNFTSTLKNNTELAHMPMRLWLNTSLPDPLGFANVSGFYGPGAWAGWYLTLCASWYSLVKDDGEGFDPSTWLYLAGMNWSAFDLVRHLHKLKTFKNAGDASWLRESASIGAAFSVVYWGQLHALLQMACVRKTVRGATSFDGAQRGITLLIGTAFPAAILAASAWMMHAWNVDYQITHNIPAMYWEGMPTHMKTRKSGRYSYNIGHDLGLLMGGVVGLWTLAFYSFLAWGLRTRTIESIFEYLCFPMVWLSRAKLGGVTFLLTFILSYIGSIVLIVHEHASGWYATWPLWIPLAFILFFLAPLGFISSLLQSCVAYIFAAYFHLETSPSKSCFFMPCAPQSITEIDQAFALFAGLFSFIVVEVIVPYVRSIRKSRRDNRLFEQQISRRLEMASRVRTQGEQPLPSAPADASTAPGATGNDIQPASRVNSGIRAEEGRAGQWTLNRVNSSRGNGMELPSLDDFVRLERANAEQAARGH